MCATCVGVGAEILRGVRFASVLIDEATQATDYIGRDIVMAS